MAGEKILKEVNYGITRPVAGRGEETQGLVHRGNGRMYYGEEEVPERTREGFLLEQVQGV